jgi:four helix bundle protein
MAHEELEETRVYVEASEFADLVWDDVAHWPDFARDTVGRQFVRAADSVSANIAESYGRYHFSDRINFLYYSRGSLYECKHWVTRAHCRHLYDQAAFQRRIASLQGLAISLNAYIKDKRAMRTTYKK